MTSIDELGIVIDFIARYCQRGLLSLIGQAEKPSWDILADAVEYLTYHKGVFVPSVDITAINLAWVETTLEAVPWENIIKAVDVYSCNPETSRNWAIYKAYVLYRGIDRLLQSGSVINTISERVNKDPRTVKKIIKKVPREIAKIAINGPELFLPLNDLLPG